MPPIRPSLGPPLRGLAVLAIATTASVLAATPRADAAPAAQPGQVDLFYGAFQTHVPIEVPAFRGLEPKLSLDYSSAAGNGLVGVGWQLSGLSSIERASPGRGAPRGDASDIFLLDGQELVPSTAYGGTHATKIDSFQRIAYDASTDTWSVWTKDGTRAVYQPVLRGGELTPTTARYALASVSDVSGQTVSYTSRCSKWVDFATGLSRVRDCLPYSITYGRVSVRFYYAGAGLFGWETNGANRPDVITSARQAALTELALRLTGIDITVGDARLRTYNLEYTTSGASQRSVLTAIRTYGRDATVSSEGVVTGGTEMPAIRLATSAAASGFEVERNWGAYDPVHGWSQWWTADVNGDGKSDLVYLDPNGRTGFRVMLAQDGYFAVASTWAAYDPINDWTRFWVQDVNGDGKADLLYLDDQFTTNGYRVMLSTGASFAAPVNWGVYDTVKDWASFRVTDVTGDGRPDLVYLAAAGWRVMRNTGSGFAAATTWAAYDAVAAWNLFWPLDVNGDGRADLVYRCIKGTGLQNDNFCVMLSSGTGFAAPSVWGLYSNGSTVQRVLPADLNGDGKQDLLTVENGSFTARIAAGSSFASSAWGTFPAVNSLDQVWVSDIDGDGDDDVVYLDSTHASRTPATPTDGYRVMRSLGTRFGAPEVWASYDPLNDWRAFSLTDVTGDGLPDLVYLDDAYTTNGWRVKANLTSRDLVTRVDNGLGGSTTVSYRSSSLTVNSNGPPVVPTVYQIRSSPGVAGSPDVVQSYAFAGGLYDRVERRFLGFHFASEQPACLGLEVNCPRTDVTFAQDYGSVSKVEELRNYVGNTLVSLRQNGYTTNGNLPPYRSLETSNWEYIYDQGQVRRTTAQRSFDGYGNVVQEITWGDYDVAGDERTTRYHYRPNTAAFIVGKPAAIDTFEGAGTAGALLAQTLFTYDDNPGWDAAPAVGKLTATARWLDTTSSFVTTRAGYDAYGNLAWETDELGARTSHVIDDVDHLFVVATTNPLGDTTASTWDPVCGVELTTTRPGGLTTARTYDRLCRVVREDFPGGGWQTTAYSQYGTAAQEIVVEGPSADGTSNTQVRRQFDGMGRTVKTSVRTSPTTYDVEDVEFDARGNVARRRSSGVTGWTIFEYDGQDRVVRVGYPDGQAATRAYGLAASTITDEVGAITGELLDVSGRVIERREGAGDATLVTRYGYDARGQLRRIVDPAGNTTQLGYDSLGRRVSILDPDTGLTRFEYDAAGRLTASTDAKQQRTLYSYDALGRRTGKQLVRADGSVEQTVTLRHDEPRAGYANRGRLTTMIDGAGALTMDYDAAGNLVRAARTIDGTTYTFEKGYDLGNRLRWTRYPDGDAIGTPDAPLGYDAAGRVTRVPGLVNAVTYAPGGPIARIASANGTITDRSYDAARGWLMATRTTGPAGDTLHARTYRRDAIGRITGIDGRWQYEYDPLGRLTLATSLTAASQTRRWTYTPTGAIASVTAGDAAPRAYRYAATGAPRPHAVLGAGAASYEYDDVGNLIAGGGRSFTWSVDNRLVAVGAQRFVYDGDGARLKTVDDATGATSITIGDDYEVTGGVVTKYVGIAGELVAKRVGTTPVWIHTNHLGSVEALSDAAGRLVATTEYGPTGLVIASTQPAGDRGFTGQRGVAGTGLVYLHARYYDAELGVFVSPDPTVPTDASIGLNRYAYAGNDPVNRVDTDGLGLFKSLKRALHKVQAELHRFGNRMLKLSERVAHIPVIGAVVSQELRLYGNIALGNVQEAVRAQATLGIMAAAAALTVASGGIASPLLYVAANAAIGYASGFLIAVVNGASSAEARQAGQSGAAISAAVATLTVFANAMRAEVQADQAAAGPNNDGNVASREFPGERNLAGGHAGNNSPLGGAQNSEIGRIGPLEYSKTGGGLWDRAANFVTEHFSGPHDFMNKMAGAYGSGGTGLSATYGAVQNLANWVNVPLTTPLALSSMLSSTGGTALIIGDRALAAAARSESGGAGLGSLANATGRSR